MTKCFGDQMLHELRNQSGILAIDSIFDSLSIASRLIYIMLYFGVINSVYSDMRALLDFLRQQLAASVIILVSNNLCH